jgi:hypothetical protein
MLSQHRDVFDDCCGVHQSHRAIRLAPSSTSSASGDGGRPATRLSALDGER